MRKKDSQEKNIQVVVRCRPRSSQEIKDYSPSVIECLPNKKEVSVRHDIADKSSVTKTFGFDRVFNPSSSQLEVYRYVVCPLLEEVLLGYNCTVFAYGQTGTGKTFTMEGEKSLDGGSWDKEPKAGIVPRAMQQLFEQLEAMPDCEFSVRVSFMEIYNEDLFDLLGSSLDSQKLRIFEDSAKKGSVFVQGIEETIVRDKNEVYEILERGRAKRQTAATLMNAQSSRSHSLFSVTVHIKESSVSGEEMLKTGKLNLVDLAGSENVGRSGAVDKRLREAGTINQSLLTLGRVITALVERAPHIPYRESKLTRLLQDSLGGRTKTTIIATISPASCNVEETLSTLDYAHRAKNILNRPEINQKLTKKTLIKEYTEEIDKLKKDLLAAREKNGIYLAIENYNDMQSKLKSREESLRSTHEKLSHLESEFATVSQLFRDTSEELSGTKNELQDTRGVLHQTRCNLKKTIEDRDGLDFVLKEYDQTEARLFARSSELLEMVNNISGDIHKLHNTLERKTHVEKTNSKHKKAYHSQFSKCIDDLQQTVFDYCKEEKSRTQERLTWLRNQVTEKNKLLSRQKEFVDDLFARRQQFVLDILDTEKRHLSSEEDWKEAVSEAVTAKKDKVIELLQLVCSNQWNDAIDCVKRSFEDTQSNLSDIQKFMAEQSAKREELVSEYLEQKRIAVEMIEGRLDKFMNEQAKQIKEISCTHRKKKDEILQCTSNMRKLIEQLTSTVDMQSGLLESKWTQEEEERCQLQLANVNFVEDSKRTLTDFPKQDAAFASVVSSHFDTTQKKIDDTVHEVFQDIEESAELHKHVEETGLYVKNNGVCIAEDWQKCINESLTDRMACSSRHFNIQQKQVEEYAKTSLSDYATLGENITYDEQQFDNMIQTSEELTHILVESLDSLKSKHSAQTDHIDEKMSTFISVDLVEDVSTGMTPIRQQYKYPTHLPRTEDRRTLWQMFKENYDVPTTPQLNVRARKLEDTAEGIDFEAEDIFMDNEGSDVDIRATENAANLEMHSQRCDDDVDNEEKENISQDVEEEKMRKKFDDGNKNQRSLSSLGVNNSTSEGVVRNKTTRLKNSSKSQ